MSLLEGQNATCPYCWETINLTLDLSVPEQSYVEDCPVCCRPWAVEVRLDESGESGEAEVNLSRLND